ncbi:MAG TPA: hypothetical protein VIC55_07455 [Gemmatimonadaceae bacterium]|jgi:hypothetical protein
MRTTLLLIALTTSLAACGWGNGSLLSGTPYTKAGLLSGTWTGDAPGLHLTLSMDEERCEWGCSDAGHGTYRLTASGETGTFTAYIALMPIEAPLPVDVGSIVLNATTGQGSAVLTGTMPDSSRLIGRIDPDPGDSISLFGVDSGFAVTFTKTQ